MSKPGTHLGQGAAEPSGTATTADQPASSRREASTQVGTVPVFASPSEAMQMVRAGLDYLAAADATAMAAQEQARCLRGLEQANSVTTAARTSILGAFAAGQGHSADADYSPRAWLIYKTGVTKGAAVAYTAWVRRAEAHPLVAAAARGRGDLGVGGADVVPVDGQAAGGPA